MNKTICEICKKEFPDDKLINGHGIRHQIEELIRVDKPEWNDKSRICESDFNT